MLGKEPLVNMLGIIVCQIYANSLRGVVSVKENSTTLSQKLTTFFIGNFTIYMFTSHIHIYILVKNLV